MPVRPPPACGQCWTLARIAEIVRRRFGAEYTLAGLDLLVHRCLLEGVIAKTGLNIQPP